MIRLRPTVVDLGDGPVLRVVRDPRDMVPLPPEGREVPLSPFWLRRLRDGDVEAVSAEASPAPVLPDAPTPADA